MACKRPAYSRTAAASRPGSLTVNTTPGSGTGTRPDAAAWPAYRRACRTEQPNRPSSTRAVSAGAMPASSSSAHLKRSLANLAKRNLTQLTALVKPGSGGCNTGPASSTGSSPAPAWISHPSVTPTIRDH